METLSITEGKVRKGGLNKKLSGPRPPLPALDKKDQNDFISIKKRLPTKDEEGKYLILKVQINPDNKPDFKGFCPYKIGYFENHQFYAVGGSNYFIVTNWKIIIDE